MSERVARAEHKAETLTTRLRRVEEWRRLRFQQLLDDLSDAKDRRKAIRAARLYLEAGVRRQAIERGIIPPE